LHIVPSAWRSPLPPCRQAHNDTSMAKIVCKIAQLHNNDQSVIGDNRANLLLTPNASEQFRPAILSSLSDRDVGDEHFFSLFQVL
jgi:hypothetical protein